MKNKQMITIAAGIFSVFIVGIVAFIGINAYSLNRMIVNEISELDAKSSNATPKTYSVQNLEGLPVPVQKYFRYVLKDGQPYITSVKYTSTGQFKLPFSDTLFEVTAREYYTANPPALIFDTMFSDCPFPGAWMHVRDKYEHETGDMYGNLFSGINILKEHGNEELNYDAFMRFVGNLILFPTSLLPGGNISWEPLDDHTATLIVRDGKHSGNVLVSFNSIGEIVQWETNRRYDKFDGVWRKVKLIGTRSNYQEIAGTKVPLAFDVRKILPDGTNEEFWKGTITDVQFNELGI